MASAGFYAIESGKISFRHDGNWYSDEERIDNPRIALLFSQSIRRNADGSYLLQVGDERAAIEVEDTPYVVRTIEGTPASGLMVILNDQSRELLDPASLEVGPGNVMYCMVKGGTFRARFLRPAYYHLSQWLEDGPAGFYLRLSGRSHPVRMGPGATSSLTKEPLR